MATAQQEKMDRSEMKSPTWLIKKKKKKVMTQHFYFDHYVHFNTRHYETIKVKSVEMILKLLLMISAFHFLDVRWKDEASFKFWSWWKEEVAF